jgi:hypothetical protein
LGSLLLAGPVLHAVPTLAEQLLQHDRAVPSAEARWRIARRVAEQDPWERVREVLKPAREHADAVRYRRRDPDPRRRRGL